MEETKPPRRLGQWLWGLFWLLVLGFLAIVVAGVLAEFAAMPCPSDKIWACDAENRTLATFIPAIGFGLGLLIAAVGGGRAVRKRTSPKPWLLGAGLLGALSLGVALFLEF
ncbi:hypothetical protein [Amycolatopsis alba]|uniref:Uncharacterized protein n=1 Tax=Amycolatopsis alba DSM 44262 TaxID=1125972 RepID=A0A229RXT0_AMYAL|nr:hypothetical protein [Amycolatopsis alba]OXM51456.1 hypothetical protein CFP75_13490 [Amycolatopsis alba DSM 44262]